MNKSLFHSLKKKLFSGELKTDVKDSFEEYLDEFLEYKATIFQLKQLVDSQATATSTIITNNRSIWSALSTTFNKSEHPCKIQLEKVAEVYLIDPLPSEIQDHLSSCQSRLETIQEQILAIDKMIAIRAEYLEEYTYYHAKYSKLVQKAKTQQLKGKTLSKKEQEKLQRNKDKLKTVKTQVEQVDENTVHVLDQFLYIRYDLLLPVVTQHLTISKDLANYHQLYLQKFGMSSRKKPKSSKGSKSPSTVGSNLSNDSPRDKDKDSDISDDSDDEYTSDDSEDDDILFHLDNIDVLMAQSPTGITNHNALLVSFAPTQPTSPQDEMQTPRLLAPIENSNYPLRSNRPRRSTLVGSLDSPSYIANPKRGKRKSQQSNGSGGDQDTRRSSYDSIGLPDDGAENDEHERRDDDGDEAFLSCRAIERQPTDHNFTFSDSDLESEEESVEFGYMKKYNEMKQEQLRQEKLNQEAAQSKAESSEPSRQQSDVGDGASQERHHSTTDIPTEKAGKSVSSTLVDKKDVEKDTHHLPRVVDTNEQEISQPPCEDNNPFASVEHASTHDDPHDHDKTVSEAQTTTNPSQSNVQDAASPSQLSEFSFAPPPSSIGSASNDSLSSLSSNPSHDHESLPHQSSHQHHKQNDIKSIPFSTGSSSQYPTSLHAPNAHDKQDASQPVKTTKMNNGSQNPATHQRRPPPTQRIGEGNQLQLQRRSSSASSQSNHLPKDNGQGPQYQYIDDNR